MTILQKLALEKVNLELTRHPGDAPWSCVECYFGKPCVDKIIYKAAKKQLENDSI
jgi:hypothetical protein